MPPRSDFDLGQYNVVGVHHAYRTLSSSLSSSSSSSMARGKCASRSVPKKKQVSFGPKVQVNYVKHINDFMALEVRNLWYSKSEMNQIREGCRRTLAAIRSGHDTYDSARGLEERTVEGNQRKQQCRIAAWDAVMDEVELQIKHYGSVNNPKRLAHLYKMTTIECTQRAREIGIHDEEETKRSIRD